jgi:hypothetical protein
VIVIQLACWSQVSKPLSVEAGAARKRDALLDLRFEVETASTVAMLAKMKRAA